MFVSLLLSLAVSSARAAESIDSGYYVGDGLVRFVHVQEDGVKAWASFLMVDGTLNSGRPHYFEGTRVPFTRVELAREKRAGDRLPLNDVLTIVKKRGAYFIVQADSNAVVGQLAPATESEFFPKLGAFIRERGAVTLNVAFDPEVEAETARLKRANELCATFFGRLCYATGLRFKAGEHLTLVAP